MIPKGDYVSMSDFTSLASDHEIAQFFRAVGKTAHKLKLESPGYRILANIGNDGMQEVPHLHVHVFGGRKLGAMLPISTGNN
mgnify:CR=1 FL=1